MGGHSERFQQGTLVCDGGRRIAAPARRPTPVVAGPVDHHRQPGRPKRLDHTGPGEAADSDPTIEDDRRHARTQALAAHCRVQRRAADGDELPRHGKALSLTCAGDPLRHAAGHCRRTEHEDRFDDHSVSGALSSGSLSRNAFSTAAIDITSAGGMVMAAATVIGPLNVAEQLPDA